MILDAIKNLNRYTDIFFINKIKQYINDNDIASFFPGDYPVNDNILLKISEYDTKDSKDLFFETHDEHIDLQYVLSGVEIMQVCDINDLKEGVGPGIEGDFKFYLPTGVVSDVVVKQGFFVVFFNGEPHRPGCFVAKSAKVKKAVFKITV